MIRFADHAKQVIRIRKVGWFRIYCALPKPLDHWFHLAWFKWRFHNSRERALRELAKPYVVD
jgi:hypothetical protein